MPANKQLQWWCEPNLNDSSSWLVFGLAHPDSKDAFHAWSQPEHEADVLERLRLITARQSQRIDIDFAEFFLKTRPTDDIGENGPIAKGVFELCGQSGRSTPIVHIDWEEAGNLLSWAISERTETAFRLIHLMALIAPAAFDSLSDWMSAAPEITRRIELREARIARRGHDRPQLPVDRGQFIQRLAQPTMKVWFSELLDYLECKPSTLKKHLIGAGLVAHNQQLQGWFTSAGRIVSEFVAYLRDLRRQSMTLHDFLDDLESAGIIEGPQ